MNEPLARCPFCKGDVLEVFADDVHTAKVPGLGLVDFVRWETVIDKWQQQQPLIPLAMPDGPGWWAFRGKRTIVATTEVELVKKALVWDMNAQPPVYRFQGDMYESVFREDVFRETYEGKWYRLTMPWENQNTTTQENSSASPS